MKQVFIRNMDEELWRKIKAQAVLEGRTMSELIQEAIREKLEKSSQT